VVSFRDLCDTLSRIDELKDEFFGTAEYDDLKVLGSFL
jgi:hypothetical protein